MIIDNPPTLGLIWLHRPYASLRGSSESNPIRARHHVNPEAKYRRRLQATRRPIGHFRLRHHDRQLAFQRDELLVLEQIAMRSRGVSNLLSTMWPPNMMKSRMRRKRMLPFLQNLPRCA